MAELTDHDLLIRIDQKFDDFSAKAAEDAMAIKDRLDGHSKRLKSLEDFRLVIHGAYISISALVGGASAWWAGHK